MVQDNKRKRVYRWTETTHTYLQRGIDISHGSHLVLFLMAVVHAWGNQIVAVMDVHHTFMQADMDDVIHVQFHGEMAAKLLEIDHALYASYVTEEKVLASCM